MESVCGGKSGTVVLVMETSVLEVSDSSCGEMMIWDWPPGICLCPALHQLGDASSVASPACRHPSSWPLVSDFELSFEEIVFWMVSGSVWMSYLRQ